MESINIPEGELAFIRHHKIPVELLFDARGSKPSVYGTTMKARGLLLAYNVTTCCHGHSLRSHRGHCVMCAPSVIAHVRRINEPGFVYVCVSKSLRLKKIGVTKDLARRHDLLNEQGYAGANDWELFAWSNCVENAGRIEATANAVLGRYRIRGLTYAHKKTNGDSREVYECTNEQAVKALWDAAPAGMTMEVKDVGIYTKAA
jgi:hypothetical protein